MLFDWFTIIAQLVNFLVLAWLLKRFLYKPILKTIDEREKRIVSQIQEAETLKANAITELESFKQKNIEIDAQRQTLLNNAINEVKIERQQLLEDARKEVEALRLHLQETFEAEKQALSTEIILRTRTEVFAIARKTLKDLASLGLEEQMTAVFVKRISEMNSEEKGFMVEALNSSSNQILIRSTFELPENMRFAIEKSVKSNFDATPEFTFETSEHLISGIELLTGGYKIVWSIDEYLLSLEASISGSAKG
jgi:F-type H+-transporting ATPase subunit b